MSSPSNGAFPSGFRTERPTSFTAANTTIAKVVVEPILGAAAISPAPAYFGGCAVIDLPVFSSDSALKDINLFIGTIRTTQDAVNTGVMATTAAGNSTITRISGSFITDGWKVGDQCMLFTPDNTAQVATAVDGIASTITAVAALTITVNGVTLAAATPLTAGTRLVSVTKKFTASIPINSGNTNAIASANLLNNSMDGAALRSDIKLGPLNMLIASMGSAVSALPCVVSIHPTVGLY